MKPRSLQKSGLIAWRRAWWSRSWSGRTLITRPARAVVQRPPSGQRWQIRAKLAAVDPGFDTNNVLTMSQQWWLYRKFGLHFSDTHPVQT